MDSARLTVLIVVALELLRSEVDGQKTCSCYTFVNGDPNGKTWIAAKKSCIDNNTHLVVMETEKEWEFINKSIKALTAFRHNEWHIGLLKDKTGKWTWINGRPLTIYKWQNGKPGKDDSYALIAREYPTGSYGSFNSFKSVPRGWICEKETDDCTGVCMWHKPATVPPTTAPPRMTSSSSTESIKPIVTTGSQAYSPDSTDSTTLATVPNRDAQQGENNDAKIVVVAACLGAVLFLALILLAVVLILRRKKRRGKDAEKPNTSSSKQTEPQYESVEPAAEAARLLGTPEVNITANSKKEPPKVECEYAVVNKANKKPKKGDLVYAQLADFDDTNNDVKAAEKPAAYEPTVYAEVVPSDVYHEVSPDSSQRTYENVKTTGV